MKSIASWQNVMEAYGLAHIRNRGWAMTSDCIVHSTRLKVRIQNVGSSDPLLGVYDKEANIKVTLIETREQASLLVLYKTAFPMLWFFDHQNWEITPTTQC
jgi:hypothetical protein